MITEMRPFEVNELLNQVFIMKYNLTCAICANHFEFGVVEVNDVVYICPTCKDELHKSIRQHMYGNENNPMEVD